MQNINYDLVKLLHNVLDQSWKLEKFYLRDAKKLKCNCPKIFKHLLAENKKHLALLREELEKHAKVKKFN